MNEFSEWELLSDDEKRERIRRTLHPELDNQLRSREAALVELAIEMAARHEPWMNPDTNWIDCRCGNWSDDDGWNQHIRRTIAADVIREYEERQKGGA